MNIQKITGRRLALMSTVKWGHTGKIDYDSGSRPTNRKTWRGVARCIKRRIRRRLNRELLSDLNE